MSIDCIKAVIGNEKTGKSLIKLNIYRIISAMMIFFLPTIINFSFTLVEDANGYDMCWDNATLENINNYESLNKKK